MQYSDFTFFNFFGGLLYSVGVTLVGCFLGQVFPPVVLDRSFLLIVIAVIVISALPAIFHAWKEYRGDVFAFLSKRWRMPGRRGLEAAE